MSQIPQNIMKAHDPNDDPFAALSDDSTNQLQSPLEYGSGISYFVHTEDSKGKEEPSTSSTDEDVAKGGDEKDDKKGE